MSTTIDTSSDADAIKGLMERKLQLVSQIQDLKAQVARINLELQKVGATSADLICW